MHDLPSAGDVARRYKSNCEWDLVRLRRGNGYVIQEADVSAFSRCAAILVLCPA